MHKETHSRLILENSHFRLIFRIETSLPTKFRRQVLVDIFRALSPGLKSVSKSYIRHEDGHFLNRCREVERGVPIRSAIRSYELPGYHYRLRRLELGLTLRELGGLARINWAQLSRIERGLVSPRARTIRRLRRVLYVEPPIQGAGSHLSVDHADP